MTDYSNHTYNARTSAKNNNLLMQSVPVVLVLLTIVFLHLVSINLTVFCRHIV